MSQGSTSAGSRLGEFHGIEIYFEAGKGSTESIQVVEMREALIEEAQDELKAKVLQRTQA